MKQLTLILILIITSVSCKAQQPIIPLYNGSDYLDTNNAYYKDVDGDFTKLIGTWEYTNGNEVLKIVLNKKLQHFSNYPVTNIDCYEDIMYGEFKYVDSDNQEVIDSLDNINTQTTVDNHLIFGGFIIGKNDNPVCDDCFDDERRVLISIKDPQRGFFTYDMEIRHVPGDDLLGVQEQIKITIKRTDMAPVPEGQPTDDRLPLNQEFVLDKL